MSDWQPIETAPTNKRVLIQANNDSTCECAMGWFDLIAQRWFYAPQGGHVSWKPTDWMPIPPPPRDKPWIADPDQPSPDATVEVMARAICGRNCDAPKCSCQPNAASRAACWRMSTESALVALTALQEAGYVVVKSNRRRQQ